jgi:hypothetical protein
VKAEAGRAVPDPVFEPRAPPVALCCIQIRVLLINKLLLAGGGRARTLGRCWAAQIRSRVWTMKKGLQNIAGRKIGIPESCPFIAVAADEYAKVLECLLALSFLPAGFRLVLNENT